MTTLRQRLSRECTSLLFQFIPNMYTFMRSMTLFPNLEWIELRGAANTRIVLDQLSSLVVAMLRLRKLRGIRFAYEAPPGFQTYLKGSLGVLASL